MSKPKFRLSTSLSDLKYVNLKSILVIFLILLLIVILALNVGFVKQSKNVNPSLGVLLGDCDTNGTVDLFDFQKLSNSFNLSEGQEGYNPLCNFNGDKIVDIFDFQILSNNFGKTEITPTPSSPPTNYLPAFPGAEGFGAKSVGGRGGKVIEVTNLKDTGTGSLRDCIDASGPRTCVFRAAGTIGISSQMNVANPYITIAGQTAPGDGITLRFTGSDNNSEGPLVVKTHDVIIRYIRSRPGPGSTTNSCCISAIRILAGYNIIVDHTSLSWGVDENLTNWFPQSDITSQWNIIAEGLSNSTNTKGEHSKGYLVGDSAKRVTVAHNLFAHNVDRNPQVKPDTEAEVINNLVYNWAKPVNGSTYFGGSADGASDLILGNAIANHYIPGPDTPTGSNDKGIAIGLYDPISSESKLYVKDNIGPGRPTNSGDDWLIVNGNPAYRSLTSVISSDTVTIYPVGNVKDAILQNSGANIGLNSDGTYFSRRDIIDDQIISNVLNKNGSIINNPSEVGGWPTLKIGNLYTDSDHDGMSDAWEVKYFGNTNRGSSADSSSDFDTDGFTDLEEFLNATNPTVKN